MEILDTLKFVQGAVSSKDLVPEMSHFAIERGTVRAYNGTLAISSPIAFEVPCKPKAAQLVHAIDRCTEATSLALMPSGKLQIRSGKFQVFIDCIEGETLHLLPEGEMVAIDGAALVAGFEKLTPFIGKDASRPWVNGILLRGQSAFATNNVCLVEYWLGCQLPFTINIPGAAIKEVIRIKEPPTHLQLTQNSVTFHYSDGRWIRSQLYSTEWPDLTKILDRPSNPLPMPPAFFESLDAVRPFIGSNSLIYFADSYLRTHQEEELGASYHVEGLHAAGIYRVEMLRLLEGVADKIDFTLYPQPLLFYGDRLRGAIIGYRP